MHVCSLTARASGQLQTYFDCLMLCRMEVKCSRDGGHAKPGVPMMQDDIPPQLNKKNPHKNNNNKKQNKKLNSIALRLWRFKDVC